MTRYVFEEVKTKREVKTKCAVCGKTIRKTFTEFQTINPFNNKTREVILKENEKRLDTAIGQWISSEVICKGCLETKQ